MSIRNNKIKLGIPWIVVIGFHLIPLTNYGQSNILQERFSIRIRNQSVEGALDRVSQKTGYNINYKYDFVERTFSGNYKNERLDDILRDIWGEGTVRITTSGKTITLKKVDVNPVNRGAIAGKVTDNFNQPVPFASVILRNTTFGASCDENGNFSFSAPAGSYIIATSVMGYRDSEKHIIVKPKTTVSVSLVVAEKSEQLDEVKVYAKSKKVELEQSAQAVVVTDTREAKLKTADLGEIMTRTEGVNVQRSGGLGSSARFNLNGLSDDQIRFFVDGIPLNATEYTNGIVNIPVDLVDRVEVYKGVVPIRFGADALGGAVNIVSNESFEGTGGTVSYQFGSFGVHRIALKARHVPANKKFFFNANGFYDIAENDYEVDVEIVEPNGRQRDATVRRFHDDYLARGMNLNFGLRNAEWADKAMIKIFLSETKQDIQNNFTMSIPFGEAKREQRSLGGLLTWNKKWKGKIAVENTLGFSEVRSKLIDTASVVYTWEGIPALDLNGEIVQRNPPGEFGPASDVEFQDKSFYNRFNLSYSLGKGHEIRVSSAPTLVSRSGENRLIEDPLVVDRLTLENRIFNLTNGVEYEYNDETSRLNGIAFAKNYLQSLNTENIENGGITTEVSRSSTNYGLGTSLRYRLNEHLLVKTSYEWATRLPNLFEVFGDGILIADNVALQPEQSQNLNLSVEYLLSNKSDFRITANGFLRDVNDLIVLIGNDNNFFHQNIADASSRGGELNVSWVSEGQRIRLSANGTYIDYINTSEDSTFGAFNGDRIPNRPYLFANGTGSYTFSRLIENRDKLTVFFGARYVNEFFRSWESAGREDTKQVIPSQLTQNLGFTYSTLFGKQKFALTGEVQNLSNEKVFDFFGVQRPGRAFYLKATYNIF
ncbi:MAG: carboxypeptidase-like regulatory domain-containing protein [Bacteroidota bacterium]